MEANQIAKYSSLQKQILRIISSTLYECAARTPVTFHMAIEILLFWNYVGSAIDSVQLPLLIASNEMVEEMHSK